MIEVEFTDTGIIVRDESIRATGQDVVVTYKGYQIWTDR